jgi:hypothetical protein
MSRRTRLVLLAVVVVVLLLFLGRWTTVMVAERWWAGTISPHARQFVSEIQLIRFILDLSGILLATLWFVGNFYIVYRAIGSVHVSRRVANLEIHEALTPQVLLIAAVSAGILLGLLTGLGTSHWWQNVLLAWKGVTYGTVDPILGKDLGLYVAQLPLWRRAHGAALLLVLLGLGICFLLYVLVGAVRWSGRRPALSDHARRHLGWLLAALAGVLAWGYWLEPYEAVAGLGATIRLDTAEFRGVVANALTGVALAAAVVSGIWSLRPRHLLMAMAWMILAFSSIIGHHVLPVFSGAQDRTIVESEEGTKRLERTAFALTRLDTALSFVADSSDAPPGPVSLWSRDQVERLGDGDSSLIVAVNQSTIRVRGKHLPVWMTLRVLPGDSAVVIAYADDRVSLSGGSLSYRLADTLGYPGTVRLLELPARAVRPRAPDYVVAQDSVGVPVSSWGRRLVLAWARQAGSLLQSLPQGSHLAWHLDPLGRFQAVAPHIAWSQPTAHVIDGELVWLSDGYVTSATFPIVERANWRERDIGAIDVPFLGAITALTGETRIYRRHSTGPLGRAWQEITGGVALPWSQVPPGIHAVLTYPDELFQLEARVLERAHWLGDRQSGPPGTDPLFSVMTTAWRQQDTALLQVAIFEATGRRGATAVLSGQHGGAQPRLLLSRIRGTEGFGDPRALDRNWKRFATYEQLRDSLRAVNTEAEPSPIKIWVDQRGVGAYQVIYGKGPERQLAVAWVNVAARDSLGAGRTMQEAWQNLLGVSAPLLSGGFAGRLGEAQEWMAIADSALKRGDWSAFGRAFEALREVLRAEE